MEVEFNNNYVNYSSVGIATGWTALVRFPVGAKDFSLLHSVQTGSGAHLTSYPMGTRGPFPGVKNSEREADHITSSAEVNPLKTEFIPNDI
jgi:hypothetical protein